VDRTRLTPKAALLTLAACVVLASGCGGSGSGEDADVGHRVSIYTDTGPKGAPDLVAGDPASGTQNQRIPITRAGVPTVVYQLPARELSDGMHLRAIANVTLTKCAITDYIPNQRAHTACQGTRKYGYDPVRIEARFRIVGGGDSPDLTGAGQDLGPTKVVTCTTAIHHCSISQNLEGDVNPTKLRQGLDPADARYVIFEVTASSPHARGCKPPKPSACNVLAVETQKGQAMYWVQADATVPSPKNPPVDERPARRTLDVLTGHGDKNDVREVVYSQELESGRELSDLEGWQFEIDSMLRISEHVPQAPDIAGYLVLADSPTSIKGRYLISSTYDDDKTGNDGGNCDTSCRQFRSAVVTSVLDCDISAGRRYVNLVADASRAAARKGEKVRIAHGGYLEVTRTYTAGESVDTHSGVTDCAG